MRVLLVCSSGGHLAQLHVLRDWWSKHDREWVTFGTDDARFLLAEEATTWCYSPTTRNVKNLLRNTALAWAVLRRYNPDVVVSTGAAVSVPFIFLGRLMGVRTAFLEVYDRITLPTLSGRLCAPVADLFMLQWPEQLAIYPRGTVVGQVF
jgi:UDP-N-acetylglucosamine:LPS N-acetylglucosamine transferase